MKIICHTMCYLIALIAGLLAFTTFCSLITLVGNITLSFFSGFFDAIFN